MNRYLKEKFIKLNEILFKEKAIILVLLSFVYFIIYLIINLSNSNYYGYFIDEFYYIACAKKLAFGYVDHPPFSVFVLFIWIKLFGTSLFSLRFLTDIFITVTFFLISRITVKLGGKLFAQIVTSISFLAIPQIIVLTGFYSMNVIELLICNLCIFLLIKIIKENKPKLWLFIGILTGIGLQNKHTFFLYIAAIFIGLIFTRERKYFLNIWFWVGLIIAVLIILPNLIWQITNNWQSLEFYRNVVLVRTIKISIEKTFINFITGYNPVLFLIWMAGLFYLFFYRDGDNFSIFGWAFIILLLFIIITRESRIDRIAGIFPVVIASGAILLEKFLSKKYFIWLKSLIILIIISSGVFFIPLFLPVLKPVKAAEYFSKYGNKNSASIGTSGKLETSLSGRIGWEDFVKKIADIYNSLPIEERSHTGIFTPHYGFAGAIDLLGKKYDLPDSISGYNNYYLWGKEKSENYDEYIFVETGLIRLFQKFTFNFDDTQQIDSISNEYLPGFMQRITIYIARKPTTKFESVWKSFKMYM